MNMNKDHRKIVLWAAAGLAALAWWAWLRSGRR